MEVLGLERKGRSCLGFLKIEGGDCMEKGLLCNAATHSGRGRVFHNGKVSCHNGKVDLARGKAPTVLRIMENRDLGRGWYGMVEVWYGMVWEGRRLLLEGPVTGRKKAWLVTMAK